MRKRFGVLVETEDLGKTYGTFAALADCSLQVQQGEVFGLLGPNGAGKTTLLRLLMGYMRPSRGQARIDGLDCFHDSVAVHQRVAYLPGDPRLFRQMRGRDVMWFFSSLRPGGSMVRAEQMAARLGLDVSRPVANLSTGMRQKLALVVAMAAPTPLLILDEPTSNLDPNVRSELIAMIHEARAAGQTVLFSSHVLDEVEQACDRVVILRGGRLVHTQQMSVLAGHRIRAELSAPLQDRHLDHPSNPRRLPLQVNGNALVVETPGELSPWLGWLATMPLANVRIEPLGLRAVYDQHHDLKSSERPTTANRAATAHTERTP